ncbi:LLM class flavin-dependent oxidoreductase [Amycolatopsis sp. H20-H5]|uniref:LLM class flavin-dependent oxidoreductase n=1 Tax=Amycolatopsis sp. H20-H5 TaxID=3046309 RepID=UPI002DB878CD|nr:LLM class flavin-dependent oxidoreductase [Amycolatopsis sp. H20-H5]MEC3975284.1 LLM class flavin-dependent oxidoreductase [Amycolatopsis sp. H20-H5]
MTQKPFRFGIVAGYSPNLTAWTAQARRVEDLGFDTLLATDPVGGADPLCLLPAAAAVTARLRLGTFVLADPFRDHRALDWQVRTLHEQTGGRFELGIGVGRPGAGALATELTGGFPGIGARIDRLAETIAYVKRTADRPKILLAASGPKMLALAAREADIVTFSWQPRTTEAEAQSIVDTFREFAGDRLGEIELGMNLVAVGDDPLPPGLAGFIGADLPELVGGGAVTVLPGTAAEAAETLRRRRDRWGISYVTTNSGYLEPFAAIAANLIAGG